MKEFAKWHDAIVKPPYFIRQCHGEAVTCLIFLLFETVFSDDHPAVLATQAVTAIMYSWQYSVYVE